MNKGMNSIVELFHMGAAFKLFLMLLTPLLTGHCQGNNSPVGPEEEYPPPQRILFVGNSMTGFNNGVDTDLARLVDASDSFPMITAENVWVAGASLRTHWFRDSTTSTIWNGNWDVVVLQEHSRLSITDTDNMYTYARLLDGIIEESGARTVFFMTWAWEEEPETIDLLVQVYGDIADELEAPVSPVGLAWRNSLAGNPALDLYADDGYHPNHRGTYLTACVFYALLWGESPEGIPYYGHYSITAEEGTYLQKIAWETVIDSEIGVSVLTASF